MDRYLFEDVRTYYVFLLSDNFFALDTSSIKGIKVGYQFHLKFTDSSRSHVIGRLDWGGVKVPVIDLGLVYCQEETPESETDMVIIVEALSRNEKTIVGLLIDGYVDIQNIKVRDINTTELWAPLINEMFFTNRSSENLSPSKS